MEWIDSGGFSDPEAAKETLLRQFADWDASLTGLVRDADGPLVPRELYAPPVEHRWPRVPGVALLGDAAHLMSPFAGEGADLAMLDGAGPAPAIVRHRDGTEKALAAYEEALFPRGVEKAGETAGSLEMLFGSEDPVAGLVSLRADAPQEG